MTNTSVTKSEVRQFIEQWFAKLDAHAPLEEVLPLVADQELEMRLPENKDKGTVAKGHKDFVPWYENAINTYFDEVHTIHALKIMPSQDSAKVEMVLQWRPAVWKAPEAKRKQLGFFAAQTWELKRSPTTQKLCIVTYNVDYFIPVEGSDDL
jgi:hypothetical protein